jgi:hypothetical protein
MLTLSHNTEPFNQITKINSLKFVGIWLKKQWHEYSADQFVMGQPSHFCSIPFLLSIYMSPRSLNSAQFAFLKHMFYILIFSLKSEVINDQCNNKYPSAQALIFTMKTYSVIDRQYTINIFFQILTVTVTN